MLRTIKKKASLLTLLSFIALGSFAQENYTNGFVVSFNGDTTKGMINYRNWKTNPTGVEFKKDQSGSVLTYSPNDIGSFGVYKKNDVEVYKSARVSIDMSSNDMSRLDYERTFKEKEENLFLLVLSRGTYTLYSYLDQKEHFFIGKGNSDITELRFKNYFLQQNNSVVKNEQYKTQLIELLKDCSEITQYEINNLSYRDVELVKLLNKYDKCKGVTSSYKANNEKAKLLFGVVAATDYAMFKTNYPTDVSLNSTGNFAAGLSLAVNLPKHNRSSSINFEFLYRQYKFDGMEHKFVSANEEYDYFYKLKGSYFKINAMYRYQFTLAKLKPFINFGISEGFKLSTVDQSTAQKRFFTTTTNYANPFSSSEKSTEGGLNLGAGISAGKLNIELRGETTNGFFGGSNVKSSVNSLYLNLNYIF